MSNDEAGKPAAKSSLVSVTDVVGVGRAAEAFANAIERGVGPLLRPWQQKRLARAQAASLQHWSAALDQLGLRPEAAELTLGEQTQVRLLAEAMQQQDNREAIAHEAIEEFRSISSQKHVERAEADPDWLDWFWRLAQNVTDADMQSVWGRVLARQAVGASKFNVRTLQLLSTLARDEARLLEKIASLTVNLPGSERMAVVTHVHIRNNAPR